MIGHLSTEGPVIHIWIKGAFTRMAGSATLCAMTKARQAVGAYGERLAAQHLIDSGMVVLGRNWRCRNGEIDIIARDGEALVFCEVKTRRGDGFGGPADAVVPAKVRRLRRLAAEWLAASGLHPDEIRFDVVSVLPQAKGPALVEHLREAF